MSKKLRGKSDINWFVTAILVGLPIFVALGVTLYCIVYGCGWKEAILGIVTYYMANISVGIGLHRLWAHGSYKTNKVVEFILMMISAGTLQGPVLGWASHHKRHHAYADTDRDPHTPVKYESKLKGFFWSHIGWMLVGDIAAENVDKGTMSTLGRSKMLRWQLNNYGAVATFMNVVPPMISGWMVFGEITFQSTFAGLFFAGAGRALQQQMTFCVNSVCHMIGTKKYANDSSCDIWWLFFLLLGENWHNFHHAFGRDYRNGHKWYHADVHKWIIYMMSKVGLARDLVITPNARIEAKMVEMHSNMRSDWQKKLENVEEIAERLAVLAKQKISAMEKSASEMADSMASKAKQRFKKLEESAENLSRGIKTVVEHSEMISAKIVNEKIRQLKMLKKLAANLGLTI
jgi:stearoyl-CoA desaturase (delta-9 desaturase)